MGFFSTTSDKKETWFKLQMIGMTGPNICLETYPIESSGWLFLV